MSNHQIEIEDLIDKSDLFGHGSSIKMELLQQAIQLADRHSELDLQYNARLMVLQTASFSGFEEQALSAFSFCMAQCESDPQRFFIQDLLWPFKYIIGAAVEFPGIEMNQIDFLLDDMTRHYKANRYSQRPVHIAKARLYSYVGRLHDASVQMKEYAHHARDRYADCSACELDLEVEANIWAHNYSAAIELAMPLTQKEQGCSEVPHFTFANLLYPAMALEQWELAADFHRKGYKLIHKNRSFLCHVSKHLFYLIHSKNLRLYMDSRVVEKSQSKITSLAEMCAE